MEESKFTKISKRTYASNNIINKVNSENLKTFKSRT